MATLNAYLGLDFLAVDLNWYARNYWDLEFYENAFAPINGIIYEDLLFVNGYDFFSDLGLTVRGSGITFDFSGNIIAGQVNAVGEYFWGGDDIWLAEGVGFSAAELYNAVLSFSTSDDLALIASALSGSDFIDLSDQVDRVSGFDGDDVIYGRLGNDILYGGSGSDEIFGENDSDILYGQDGNDLLVGGSGNDFLFGGTGNDVLDGQFGFDQATGGSGADLFVFYVGDGVLTVTDFEAGIDDLAIGGLAPGFTVLDLLPFVAQQGSDVVIASGGQEIRFQNTSLSELSGGDVVFV
jgi:Ca2+-binding RTX toxin-like protein